MPGSDGPTSAAGQASPWGFFLQSVVELACLSALRLAVRSMIQAHTLLYFE